MIDFILRHFSFIIRTREQARRVLILGACMLLLVSFIVWYRVLQGPIVPPAGYEGNMPHTSEYSQYYE